MAWVRSVDAEIILSGIEMVAECWVREALQAGTGQAFPPPESDSPTT